ncbi:TonB-dependent receptor-like protein [Eilatimonas milleporae]|uniref:TonB-dependent receptor-like protein n=2 Tax=Eilatimonas milleporae TaxID=911205 RepID=A0A3M0CGF2_9PROT|nr:TonB-dependent receptor-like protein [Eilatimonas milleporae]
MYMIRKPLFSLITASATAVALIAPVRGQMQDQTQVQDKTQARDRTQAQDFSIAAQPMADALSQYSRQADVAVIAPARVTRGKTTAGLAGRHAPAAALEKLLAGSGLVAARDAGGAVLISASPRSTLSGAAPSTAAPETTETDAWDAGAPDGYGVETIVVTGSKIPRQEFMSTAPLSIISSEEIKQSGFVNIDDTLLRNPSVGVGLGSANGTRNENAGAAFVNLRGLGVNRSLVLVDGKRRVSGSRSASAVDLNTIPAALVERIDVVTGGASAVYGADAVSGVVNIITKNTFDGLEITAGGGLSQGGGAETYNISVLGGSGFDDGKGNISVAVTYNNAEALFAEDRDFARSWTALRRNPENTGPDDGIFDQVTLRDLRVNTYLYEGSFIVDDMLYAYDRTRGLRLVDQGTPVSRIVAVGGEGRNINDDNVLRIPQELLSLRGDLDYDLTDDIAFFTTFDVVRTETTDFNRYIVDDGRSLFGRPQLIRRDNPFVPDEVAALMDANGLSEINVRKTPIEYGLIAEDHDRTLISSVSGFRGNIAGRHRWEAFFQYDHSMNTIQTDNARIEQNYLNAIDAVTDPVSGETVCRSEAARAQGCVPINVIGRHPFTDAQRAYVSHTRLQDVENTLLVAGGQMNGELFSLPAGPVQYAAGVEYRDETLRTRDDGLALANALVLSISPRAPVDADFDVAEAFAEFRVPLLVGRPFADYLELEGAVRVSDYSTVGRTTAWRVGGVWSPVEDITIRANYARNVRAPNLFELFESQFDGQISFRDPCFVENLSAGANRAANCAALGVPADLEPAGDSVDAELIQVLGGNPDLREETATSFSAGLVVRPRWIDNLVFSVDYYNIEIEDAVGSFDVETITNRCVDAATVDNVFCRLITRGADGRLVSVSGTPFNIGELTAQGLDFQVAYDLPVGDGQLSFNLLGSYLIENEELVDPTDSGSLVINDGEVDNPALRWALTTSYAKGAWSAGIINRFIGASKLDRQVTDEAFDINEVDPFIYTDLRFQYAFDDRYTLDAIINNVFDTDPPFSDETVDGTGRGGLYDNIGRFFQLQLTARF